MVQKHKKKNRALNQESGKPMFFVILVVLLLLLAGALLHTGGLTALEQRLASPTSRPTPRPTIKNIAQRYAGSFVEVEGNSQAMKIEYRILPKLLIRNEYLASESVHKILCALRRHWKGTWWESLEFMGTTRFVDAFGKTFYAPSVEMHIDATTAKKISCGADHIDIDWKEIASFYKSHRIPKGARVDDQ